MNVCNEIFNHNKDNIAVIGEKYNLTYGELESMSSNVAHKFASLGFKRGDIILLQGNNSPDMIVGWLASVRSGGSAVFMDNDHNENIINNIYKKAGCSFILNENELHEIVKKSFSDNYPNFGIVDVDKGDICEVTLTSGTSGDDAQSVIKHSHENTLFSMRVGQLSLGEPTEKDVFYGSASLSFAYGISSTMIVPLLYGSATIMVSKKSLTQTLDLIHQHKVSYFFSGPVFYRAALPYVGNKMDSVKYCCSAGDYLPSPLRKKWKESTGIYLTNILGAAEGQYILVCSVEDDTPDDCVGRIVPGYTITSEGGKMIVRSKYSTFSTNDSVTIKDDLLYFHGRTDDLIITSQGKFNPSYVENVCMESGVLEDVFAKSIKKLETNHVQLFCVKHDNDSEDYVRKTITKYCTDKLPTALQPVAITFVSKLPRTMTGKAQRKLI